MCACVLACLCVGTPARFLASLVPPGTYNPVEGRFYNATISDIHEDYVHSDCRRRLTEWAVLIGTVILGVAFTLGVMAMWPLHTPSSLEAYLIQINIAAELSRSNKLAETPRHFLHALHDASEGGGGGGGGGGQSSFRGLRGLQEEDEAERRSLLKHNGGGHGGSYSELVPDYGARTGGVLEEEAKEEALLSGHEEGVYKPPRDPEVVGAVSTHLHATARGHLQSVDSVDKSMTSSVGGRRFGCRETVPLLVRAVLLNAGAMGDVTNIMSCGVYVTQLLVGCVCAVGGVDG
jgi:hypothetical protein